jgi:CubicO group peptidase (beta-lactamase class C family)
VRAIAALLALTLLQAPAPTPSALPPTRDQLFGLFGRYLESLRIQAGIPGMAAAIMDSDGLAWEQSFGYQDLSIALRTRTDTPFHLDGLTQIVTATLVLRCVEEGRLTLDTRVGTFSPASPDASATIGQILTHTFGNPNDLTFAYRPERLDVLAPAVSACRGATFRGAVAGLLDQLVMFDSVPGPDVVTDPALPVDRSTRFTNILSRLAVPYSVDAQGRASASRYEATTLTPSSGLISTVLNFAQFDQALRQGYILRPETLEAAWRPPVGPNGSLPHGYGWFVQAYNNEPVVWQFGVGANASSSLVITLPTRGITLVLLANSDGLAKPSKLAAGDITASPFARLFFQLLVK